MGHSQRYRPVVLGPLYSLRVEDLRAWHRLEVTCATCGKVALVTPDALRQRHARRRLIDIERQLRCSHCKNRDRNGWQVVQLGRD